MEIQTPLVSASSWGRLNPRKDKPGNGTHASPHLDLKPRWPPVFLCLYQEQQAIIPSNPVVSWRFPGAAICRQWEDKLRFHLKPDLQGVSGGYTGQKSPDYPEYHRSKQLSIYSCLILEARLTQDFLCLTWQSPPAFTSFSLWIFACFTSDVYPCNADCREDTLLLISFLLEKYFPFV